MQKMNKKTSSLHIKSNKKHMLLIVYTNWAKKSTHLITILKLLPNICLFLFFCIQKATQYATSTNILFTLLNKINKILQQENTKVYKIFILVVIVCTKKLPHSLELTVRE